MFHTLILPTLYDHSLHAGEELECDVLCCDDSKRYTFPTYIYVDDILSAFTLIVPLLWST